MKFALEVHPTEIAYDFVTTRKTLDAIGNRPGFGINLDPSHFAHQFLDTAAFAIEFADRIYHVHVKDSRRTLDGRSSILGGHLNFGEPQRGWDFVSPGHGDVDFETFFRALNRIGYHGAALDRVGGLRHGPRVGGTGLARVRSPHRLRAVGCRVRRGDAAGWLGAHDDRLQPAGRDLMRALDEALPQFDVNEVHSISLACGPEEAVQRALAAPAAPDRLTAALFRARGLRRGTTIQELFDRTGFETIARSPTDVVFATSGTPWRPSGGLRPFAAADPGTVRVATDIRAVAVAGGCVLSTETRVQAVDDAARRAFRRYWLVVGPFSGLIRRRWLRAAARS